MSRPLSATPFRATFDGQQIFDAMSDVRGGWGEYAALRAWEMELMLSMRLSEEEYSKIPLKQRARMVAGMKLSSWMKALESDKAAKEAKRRV